MKAFFHFRNLSNVLLLGIFLLVWSNQAYFVAGNTFKYLSLLIGFLLIIYSSFILPFKANRLFYYFSSLFFVLFISVAFVQNHQNTDLQNLTFSFVCYVLLLCGYQIGANFKLLNRINPIYFKVILIFSLLGSVFYFTNISKIEFQGNTRSFGDEYIESAIHAIGISYTNSLVFLLIFVVFLRLKNELGLFWKFIFLFVILSVFFIVFSSQSRGPFLFLIFTLLVVNKKYFFDRKTLIKSIFYFLIFISAVFFLHQFILDSSSIISVMIDNSFLRLSNLFKSTGIDLQDASSLERMKMFNQFLSESENIILFGKFRYKPYPHNQFIEIIMRWGFLGFPMLFFSIYCFIKASFYLFLKNTLFGLDYLVISLFFLSYLVSMTSLSLEFNRVLWIGFGFVAGFKIKKVVYSN